MEQESEEAAAKKDEGSQLHATMAKMAQALETGLAQGVEAVKRLEAMRADVSRLLREATTDASLRLELQSVKEVNERLTMQLQARVEEKVKVSVPSGGSEAMEEESGEVAPSADGAPMGEQLVVESKPVEQSVIESKPVEQSVVESKPVEQSVIESKPVEQSVVESMPIEQSQVVESQPVEDHAAESQPVEPSPMTESQPTEQSPMTEPQQSEQTQSTESPSTEQPLSTEPQPTPQSPTTKRPQANPTMPPEKQAHIDPSPSLTLPILKFRLRYAYKKYLPKKMRMLGSLFRKINHYTKTPDVIFEDLCKLWE